MKFVSMKKLSGGIVEILVIVGYGELLRSLICFVLVSCYANDGFAFCFSSFLSSDVFVSGGEILEHRS